MPPIENGSVIIDSGALRDAEPNFFSIDLEGKKINFFVLKIDGDVESFFDACEKCYLEKRGYRKEGTSIVCNYCGVRYSISALKDGIGSCRPVPLIGELKDEKYIISLEEIKKGIKYF